MSSSFWEINKKLLAIKFFHFAKVKNVSIFYVFLNFLFGNLEKPTFCPRPMTMSMENLLPLMGMRVNC